MKTLFKNEAKKRDLSLCTLILQVQKEGILHINKDIEPALPLSVALLGMGADMHTASLFRIKKFGLALSKDAPNVVAVSAPGIPEPRISLTARVLNSSQEKHLVFFGVDKGS